MINFENLDKLHFAGTGKYEIPEIKAVKAYPHGESIPMNFMRSEKLPQNKIMHCFTDDYQFARFWNTPDRYIEKLS